MPVRVGLRLLGRLPRRDEAVAARSHLQQQETMHVFPSSVAGLGEQFVGCCGERV